MTSRASSLLAAALIAVDVGHYHAEPGVISYSGVAEFEFNHRLALEIRKQLEDDGQRVRMIGDKGNLIFLNHRTRAAKGADLFLSVHHDSAREHLHTRREQFAGFSLFVSRKNPKVDRSLACASAIGEELRGAGMVPSRYHADPVIGENRPFADERNGVHYYDNLGVAKTASMPAVLVEAGVIINKDDEARMNDPAVRARIAAAITRGVRRCLP